MKTRTLLALLMTLLMLVSAVTPFASFADDEKDGGEYWTLTDEELPESSTLVGTTHLPPISNQGAIGSCASQSITYEQMTNAVSRYLHSIDPDIEWDPSSGDLKYLMTPKFTYDFSGSGTAWVYNILCEHGITTMDKLAFPMRKGTGAYYIFKTSANTYQVLDTKASMWYVGKGDLLDALNIRLKNYEQIWVKPENFGGVPTNSIMMTTSTEGKVLINKIKNAVVDGNVVVTGGISGGWRYTKLTAGGALGKKGEEALFYTDSNGAGGHQVSIVGYDDNIECVVEGVTLKGGFLVANSWGTDWANDGYFWLMYDAMNAKSEYAEINAKYPNRMVSMDQYCFTNWRTDITVGLPELMVQVEVEATYREAVHIKLVRQNKTNSNDKERHTPWLFEYGLGGKSFYHDNYDLKGAKYTFSGKYIKDNTKSETGYFTLSYEALLESIPEGKTFGDYDWGVRIYSTFGYPIVVKSIKLIDSNEKVLDEYDLPEGGVKMPENPVSGYSAANTVAKDFMFNLSAATITAEENENCTVEYMNSGMISAGDEVSFKVNPVEGQAVSKVLVNGVEITPVDGVYKFVAAASNDIKVETVAAEAPSTAPGTAPSTTQTGDDTSSEGGNDAVIIIIVVVVVVVLGGGVLAVVLMKKKK